MQREERVGRGRAEARAAMFIEADLSWVGGAPAAGASCGSRLEWRVLRGGEMQTVWIDREQLHRSTRTLDTLRNRFPKALPKLVGDVEQWVAQREQLLSILKASLHDGAKLPRDLFAAPSAYPARVHAEARRLRAAHPKLGTALDDLSWYCAADDRRARRLIRWMEEDAAVFEALHEGLPPDMRRSAFASLVALYEGDGPRRIRPLMEGLADPRLYRLPMWTGGEARHLVTRLMRAWSVEPPAWQEGPPHGLVGFLTRLSGMQTAGRRRVLRIVGITWPTEQLEAWARWRERWCSLVADMRTAGRLAPKAPPIADVLAALSLDSLDGRELQRRLGEWLSTAKRLGASQPKHVIWPHWPQDLLQFGDPELAALVGPLERLLPKLPGLDRDVEAPRLWYALVWPLAIRRGQSRPRSAVKEIRALSWALAQPEFEYRWWHDRQGALTEHTLKTYYLRPFADLGWTSPVAPEVWMRVFVEIARRVRGAPHERVELLELIRSHGPSELTVRLALAWHSAGLEAWVPDGIVSTAARLSRGDEHVFVDFLRTWQARQDEDEDGVADALRALVRHFEAAGALEVLVRLHSDGRFFPLSPWGDLLVVASSTSSFPRPQAMGAVEATWIRRYPEPLWSSLAELAWARDDAEPAAARLLDKDWPDPARLEAEIAAIGARLRSDPGAPAGLNKRLESLRRRLEHPKPPSPARLSNLEKKIQLATAEAHVEDWKRRVAVYAKERGQERLGAPAASWPKGNLRRRTLFALTHLPPADRRVAGRLLKAGQMCPPGTCAMLLRTAALSSACRSVGSTWGPGSTATKSAWCGRRTTLCCGSDSSRTRLRSLRWARTFRPVCARAV